MTASPRSHALAALIAVLLGVADWFAWLSWGFDDDHAYSSAQVIGCGACAVVAVAGLVAIFRRVLFVLPAMAFAAGLTMARTVWAALDGGDGLFLVGTVMLMVGSSTSLLLVAGLTDVIARRLHRAQ